MNDQRSEILLPLLALEVASFIIHITFVVYLGAILWSTEGGTQGNNVIMGWAIVNK